MSERRSLGAGRSGAGAWSAWLAIATLLALLTAARPAAAAPLVYTIDPSQSTITGNLRATFDITVTATCLFFCGNALGSGTKDFSGSGQVGDGTGAPLASNPSGTITADWGSPGWSDSITFTSAAIDNANPGSAAGSFSVGLPLGLTATFDGTVNISNISIGLGSSLTVMPLNPSEAVPGAGPWTSSGTAKIVLGATAGGSVMGTGLLSFIQFMIPPFTFGGSGPGNPVTIDGTLSRLGSGSELAFDAMGAWITLGPQAPSTIDVNYDTGLGVTIDSVTLALTSLTLDNIDAQVIATETTTPIPVPEPGTLALLGSGLLGLALRRGRDR